VPHIKEYWDLPTPLQTKGRNFGEDKEKLESLFSKEF